MKLLSAACAAHWAMREKALVTLLNIAARRNEPIEAVEAQLGKELDNTHAMTVRDGVATIFVTGPLFRYANLFTAISGASSYAMLALDFNVALADQTVKSIVLNVNSPGGEVDGCNELADMIFAARGKKPIVAYVGGEACSAGYWIATAADRIVADETAIVGSIGVCASVVDTTKWQESQGIEERMIVSSNAPKKNLGANGITEESVSALLATLNGLESVFHQKVARNRNVSVKRVRAEFGRGAVFVAGASPDGEPSGLDAGLVDSIGSYESVIAELTAGAVQSREAPGPLFVPKTAHTPGPAIAAAASLHAEDAPMDPEMKKAFEDLNAKIDANRAANEAAHAATQKKIDDDMEERKKKEKKEKEEKDDVVEPDKEGAVELDPAIVALTGVSGQEAVGRVAAWKASAEKLPGVEAELSALKNQGAAAARTSLIDGMLINGKLKPTMKGWAQGISMEALIAYEKDAPAASGGHREPPTNTPAGGGMVISADSIPTEATQRKAFLQAQFNALPEAERKQVIKSGTDPIAFMESRIKRSNPDGSVRAYGAPLSNN